MGKADKTRQLIAEKTAPIFNKKGFGATSLSDLTLATGLTKGALYGNYKDKEAIRMAAFGFAMQEVRTLAQTQLAQAKSFKGKLTALVGFFASYVLTPPVEGGCPLLNTAIEVDDGDESMRAVVVKELKSTVHYIAWLLEKGVAANEFKSDIDSKALAYTFFCSIEGALMFSRVEQSKDPMNMVVEHCKKILDQISK
jgi:AcrR family transcriptional regulator